MSEAIVIALITGGVTLVGTIITVMVGNSKSMAAMEKHQAVTDTKIEVLTREVQKHNNVAERLPVAEANIEALARRIDKIESRVG